MDTKNSNDLSRKTTQANADIFELVKMITDNLKDPRDETATWSDFGDAAHARALLVEAAAALGALDGETSVSRFGIEL